MDTEDHMDKFDEFDWECDIDEIIEEHGDTNVRALVAGAGPGMNTFEADRVYMTPSRCYLVGIIDEDIDHTFGVVAPQAIHNVTSEYFYPVTTFEMLQDIASSGYSDEMLDRYRELMHNAGSQCNLHI